MLIKLYACERADVRFIDEPGLTHCGTLELDVSYSTQTESPEEWRYWTTLARMPEDTCIVELELSVHDAELKIRALDLRTGICVRGSLQVQKNAN